MGPQHPSTHGVLRVKLKLDGERVIGSECVIGYLHRGVEKIAENRTYQQFAPYVDRMDYVAAVSNGRSEEHTSELQSLRHLVCRLLLEKKKHLLSYMINMQ